MISSTSKGSVALGLLLCLGSGSTRAQEPLSCTSQDQPNPLKNTFPNEVTGLLNGTLAIAPIPLEHARRIIPANIAILETAYRALVPDFPHGYYPMLVQAVHDHDINFGNYSVPDFSRAGFEFPFLDLLQDGHSSFRWAPSQLVLSSNEVAIQGSEAYGTLVDPASFEPPCDAYGSSGQTYFKATSLESDKFMSLDFASIGGCKASEYTLDFFKNITNQPSFANGTTCDQMIRFFNTTVTEPPYDPVAVVGNVSSNLEPFSEGVNLTSLHGFQVASAFIERNYLNCSDFQSYEV